MSGRQQADGNSGGIDIRGELLLLRGGAQISASVLGRGSAGQIVLHPERLIVTEGSQISADVNRSGQGYSGGIVINAPTQVAFNTGARTSSSLLRGSTGRSGSISIQTGSFLITGGAEMRATNEGRGDSGGILIDATQVKLDESAELSSNLSAGAVGNSGNIQIETDSFLMQGGSTISSENQGEGRSGNITVNARSLLIQGGSDFTSTNSGAVNSRSGTIQITVQQQAELLGGSRISSGVTPTGAGSGGGISVRAGSISIRGGSELNTSVSGTEPSQPGSILLRAQNRLFLEGSRIFSSVSPNVDSDGGNIRLSAGSLTAEGSEVNASTSGNGNSGLVNIQVLGQADFRDSAGRSGVDRGAGGNGGSIRLRAGAVALNNSELEVNTFGEGDAGRIQIQSNEISLANRASISARTSRASNGSGGDISIQANQLNLDSGSSVSALSRGTGRAGEIALGRSNQPITELNLNDARILTTSRLSSGGGIGVSAEAVRLRGNSDIRTQVQQGEGGGGDITVDANFLIAYDDSDMIAAAERGQGGNINFGNTVAFFENYSAKSEEAAPQTLQRNNQADLNATGSTPGLISLSDTSAIQNSLADLPANALDTENLLANSCIASTEDSGTFLITGSGGLPPNRPGSTPPSIYPTDTVRNRNTSSNSRDWQPGDPIVEPQGVYRLPNGELVLSHECSP